MAGRLWLLGALCLLAAAGFVFYGVLWVVRYMQTHMKLALAGAVIVLGGCALAWWCCAGQPGGAAVELQVQPGQPLWSVARALEQRGAVRWAPALVAWMDLSGSDRRVQAGIHRFDGLESVFAAARRLQHAVPVEVAVTVPEGLVVEQVAAIMAAELHLDSARFVAACGTDSLLRSLGLEESSAEGYLFPDTYRFPPNATEEAVVRTMVARFREQYARVALDTLIGARFPQRDIVTLASIVEKEATLAEERGHIAGVFHNRLRLGIQLGADPTVRYALRKFEGPLRVSELNSRSPYNTRVYRGLPPGPICSPGLPALQAAAAPLATTDLYFVARWDGSGGHDFSKTLAEHERKTREIRRQNEQLLRELRRNG